MAQIIAFPVRNTIDASVWCDPLKLHFPQVFRGAQTVTQEAFDLLGPPPGLVVGSKFVYFTLDPDHAEYPDATDFAPISSMQPDSPFSLIVRWHANNTRAYDYMSGVIDFNPQVPCRSFRNSSGYFTLSERLTNPVWPGPMIFYVALLDTIPVTLLEDDDHWELSAAPGGRPEPSQLLFLPENNAA